MNSYCVADFAALCAATAPSASDAELKALLVSATDIPADRIDTCFDELKAGDMFNAARGMALILGLSLGKAPTIEQLADCFEKAVWNDDGENHATISCTFLDEDGTQDAKVVVTKNY